MSLLCFQVLCCHLAPANFSFCIHTCFSLPTLSSPASPASWNYRNCWLLSCPEPPQPVVIGAWDKLPSHSLPAFHLVDIYSSMVTCPMLSEHLGHYLHGEPYKVRNSALFLKILYPGSNVVPLGGCGCLISHVQMLGPSVNFLVASPHVE